MGKIWGYKKQNNDTDSCQKKDEFLLCLNQWKTQWMPQKFILKKINASFIILCLNKFSVILNTS